MTRSMYLSSSRSEATTSRVVSSWMEVFGTCVVERAVDIVSAIALNDWVVSLPPVECLALWDYEMGMNRTRKPLRMAALPDLIANEAILAMTSGRASKMIRRVPIGQVTRFSSRPSSSRVRRVTLPTTSHRVLRSATLL